MYLVKGCHYVGFEVYTVVTMKGTIFRDVNQRRPAEGRGYFLSVTMAYPSTLKTEAVF
jgi:hypothetical protein